MAKVLQIRDVPDEVYDALARAAKAQGMSLTGYLRRELERLATRERRAADNATVIRETRRRVGGDVDRETILSTLHECRAASDLLTEADVIAERSGSLPVNDRRTVDEILGYDGDGLPT